MTTFRSVLIALAIAAATAGCAAPAVTAPAHPDGSAPATAADDGSAVASPVPSAGSISDDPVYAAWRRSPITSGSTLTLAADAACRAAPAVGSLPRVVLDARGEGVLIAVFADAASAAVCRVVIDPAGVATAVARLVKGDASAAAPGASRLGLHDLEVVAADGNPRSFLVGRVGASVHAVSVEFDADAAWSPASMAGGWYAIWWPSAERPQAVAAIDARSVALDSFRP